MEEIFLSIDRGVQVPIYDGPMNWLTCEGLTVDTDTPNKVPVRIIVE